MVWFHLETLKICKIKTTLLVKNNSYIFLKIHYYSHKFKRLMIILRKNKNRMILKMEINKKQSKNKISKRNITKITSRKSEMTELKKSKIKNNR